MQSPVYALKNFFSRKDVSVICLILAIIIKILLVFYFQQVDRDKLFQAMAGKNLAEGHGLTIQQVHTNNLSKENYTHLRLWPPAYSVLFAIIYTFVNNLNVTCFIIDIICVVLFLILLRKFLTQLEFPDYLINLLVLFNGCTIAFYITVSAPTDFLTLLLIVYNCYLSIELFRQRKPLQGLLLGFFNVLPAWFRYMYIPLSFVIPGILLWNGWVKKDRKFLLYGTYTMAMALLSSIALLSIQEPYVVPAEKGIFWSNLSYIAPVLFTAFMDLNFFLVQLSHLTGISYKTCLRILQLVDIVPFLFLLASLFYSSFKRKWLAANNWQLFMIIGTLTGICTFLVLALLSLRLSMHVQSTENYFWTYVSEDRYFIFIQFFIVIIAARWLFMNADAFRLKKWTQGLFLFLFSIEILHAMYFLAKNFTFDRKNFDYGFQYIDNTIRENKKKNIDVVVAGDPAMANRAVLMGGKGLFVPAELNAAEIHADKPTKLITVLKRTEFTFYSPFLKKEGIKLETQIGEFYFYSYNVKPI